MPAELPWSELVRRRNGLPPTELRELAELTAQQPDHIRYALAGLGITSVQPPVEPEPDPGLSLLTISPAMLHAYVDSAQPQPSPFDDLWDGWTAYEAQPERVQAARERLAGARAESRCLHTELPTTMCHHCKETSP